MDRLFWRVICFVMYLVLFSPILVFGQTETNETYLRVMTFNIENGGNQIDFNQIANAIKQAKADVVGIQEAWGNVKKLAKALHWNYYDPYQHIISRFPLFKTRMQHSFLLIEIKPNHFISMANLHLSDDFYGPEFLKQGINKKKVSEQETKIRLSEAKPIIDHLSVLASEKVPVFLTGDFNSPSHLDWIKVTRNKPVVMNWPVTYYLNQLGFIDSYRKIFPNPDQNPGYTWPAARPFLKNSIDGFNPSNNNLPERIDFIFYSGPTTVINSQLTGEKNSDFVTYQLTPWPSDHRAVVSQFKVIPSKYPKQHMQLIPITGEFHDKKPEISAPKILSMGKPIPITWKNAPGYYYDYISIASITNKDVSQAVRLYTKGRINGVVHYTHTNVKGNWIHWSKTSNAHWPLYPGVYNIQLMLDDGYTSLAATQIIIKP